MFGWFRRLFLRLFGHGTAILSVVFTDGSCAMLKAKYDGSLDTIYDKQSIDELTLVVEKDCGKEVESMVFIGVFPD